MKNTYRKQTIIVTGGLGYIGSHTVVELLQANYNVIIIDNLSNSSLSTLDKIEQITSIRPIFFNHDITNYEQLDKVFKDNNADAVIHFAAYKAVGESIEQPLKYYYNNLVGIMNLLKCIQQHHVKRLIFSSSATVYGDTTKQPIGEASPTQRPQNPYGNTKKVSEEIIEDFCIANNKTTAISLRYFNPIGAHSSGKIGEKPNGIPNNLMPYITQTAKGIRKELTIFGNDYPTVDGTGVRDYIHVVDLANAHVKAVEFLFKLQPQNYFTFNIGTGKGYSVLELINAFEKTNNIKVNYKFGERRKGDVAVCFSNPKLAEELLKWEAKLSLDDMVRSAWRYEQHN